MHGSFRMEGLRVRLGTIGMVSAVGLVVLVYIIGLALDNWVVVYRDDASHQALAQMGIFQACGFNNSLEVVLNSSVLDKQRCFSLVKENVGGWITVVQVFSIVCLAPLVAMWFVWAVVIFLQKIENKNFMIPLAVLWISTGLLMVVHTGVFAGHMRPGSHVIADELKTGNVTDVQWITTAYGGGFIIHCVISGIINFVSLVGLCVLCLFCRCYGYRKGNF